MKNIDKLINNLKRGIFPNHKNRIWTMCNVTIKMILQTIEEAEKYGMTDEQFYLSWEDILNKASCKDHNEDISELFKQFHSDSGN